MIINNVINYDYLYQFVATIATGSDMGVVNMTIYGKSSYLLSIITGPVEALSGWSGNKPGFDSGIVMSVQSMMSYCSAKHSGM